MTNMGPMHFYTGVPDSKAATLPSYPRKGKAATGEAEKPVAAGRRFLWGGYTVEIKYDKNRRSRD